AKKKARGKSSATTAATARFEPSGHGCYPLAERTAVLTGPASDPGGTVVSPGDASTRPGINARGLISSNTPAVSMPGRAAGPSVLGTENGVKSMSQNLAEKNGLIGNASVKLERSLFEFPRSCEYFDVRELQTMTGQSVDRLPDVIVKELLDNAADAAESA